MGAGEQIPKAWRACPQGLASGPYRMLQCGPQWTDNARGFTDSARAGTSEERHNLSARRAEEVSMANTCANPLMTGACLGQSKYSSSYRRFPPA